MIWKSAANILPTSINKGSIPAENAKITIFNYQNGYFLKRHIPNFFTLSNLLLGCVALYFSFQGNLTTAFLLVLAAMVCDVLDGFLARWLKVDGPLGVQLDSLADMVTFGVVPGAMMVHMLAKVGIAPPALAYLGFLIPLGSAWRLARFNITSYDHHDFVGLATPSATLLIGGLALVFHRHPELHHYFTPIALLGVTVGVVWLMNSPLRMFSLKSKDARGWLIGFAFGVIILGIFLGEWAFPLAIVSYILLSLLRRLLQRKLI